MADMQTSLPVFQFEAASPGVSGGVGAQATKAQIGVSVGKTAGGVKMYADTTDIGAGSTLPAFLDKLAEPKREALRQQRVYEGFVAAAMGKSAQEINESVPWYAQIFGDTPYQQGAQAFGVQKATAEFERLFVENISDLVTKEPEDVMAWAVEQGVSLSTGDAMTDAMIQKGLMDRLPPMLKTYTSARVEWQQNQLKNAFGAARDSEAGAFGAMMSEASRRGEQHPDQQVQIAAATRNFVQGWARPVGMTAEAHADALKSGLMKYTRDGNFFAVNTLIENGALDTLDYETRHTLEGQLETAADRFRSNMVATDPELIRAKAQVQAAVSSGTLSAAGTVAAYDEINRLYMARYGDRRGLFDMDDYVRGAQTATEVAFRMQEKINDRAYAEYRRKLERAENLEDDIAKDALKAQLEREAQGAKLQLINDSIDRGNAGDLVATGAATESEVQRQMLANWRTDPTGTIPKIVANGTAPQPLVSTAIKTEIAQTFLRSKAGVYTPDFEKGVALFDALQSYRLPMADGVEDTTSGPAMLATYFSDEHIEAIREYKLARENGSDPEMALANAVKVAAPRAARASLDKEERAAIEQALRTPNMFSQLFLGAEAGVAPRHKGVLSAAMAEEMVRLERIEPGMTVQQRAEAALKAAQARRVDVAGEHSWLRADGQAALNTYGTAVSPDVYSHTLAAFINEQVKTAGLDYDDDTIESIIRLPDRDGWPQLLVEVLDAQGRRANIRFSKAEFERVNRQALERRQATARAQEAADPIGNNDLRTRAALKY